MLEKFINQLIYINPKFMETSFNFQNITFNLRNRAIVSLPRGKLISFDKIHI